jgi:hypothetical protein
MLGGWTAFAPFSGGLGVVYQNWPRKDNVLAAIQETVDFSATVSACLPRENSFRLASVYEMLKISAYPFISIGSGIDHLQVTLGMIGDGMVPAPKSFEAFQRLLSLISSSCASMALDHTKGIVESIQKEQETKKHLTNGDIRNALKEINRSLVQELENEVLLHVNRENAKLFCRADPFGPTVSKHFTSCVGDIWVAGNCFAMELYDASVFHLMRALERVLAALAAKFNVAFDHRNWHNIIEELESHIRKIDSSCGVDWKDQQKKYSQAASQFMFFKDAWRNHVTHGRDTFDGTRAKIIYDSTGHFMTYLADIGLTA